MQLACSFTQGRAYLALVTDSEDSEMAAAGVRRTMNCRQRILPFRYWHCIRCTPGISANTSFAAAHWTESARADSNARALGTHRSRAAVWVEGRLDACQLLLSVLLGEQEPSDIGDVRHLQARQPSLLCPRPVTQQPRLAGSSQDGDAFFRDVCSLLDKVSATSPPRDPVGTAVQALQLVQLAHKSTKQARTLSTLKQTARVPCAASQSDSMSGTSVCCWRKQARNRAVDDAKAGATEQTRLVEQLTREHRDYLRCAVIF